MKKNLVLIGAADSIGVPYTRDNREHQGFFEMIGQELSKKYDVVPLNCFHMSTNNDNRYIDYLISSDASLLDVKNSQNQMLKKCKYSGVYPYLELPKNFLNHYRPTEADAKVVVREYIKKYDTIFIYSAFVNDLLKSQNLSLFKLLRPGRIKQELGNVSTKDVLRDLENNIKKLTILNPNIQIYVIGLFIPTKVPYIRKSLCEFISSANTSLRSMLQKYINVTFVDNDNLSEEDFNNIDFHPNRKGHEKIHQNLLNSLHDKNILI